MKSWLLLAALALLFADIIAVIILQAGGFALWRGTRRGAAARGSGARRHRRGNGHARRCPAHTRRSPTSWRRRAAPSASRPPTSAPSKRPARSRIGYVLTGDQNVDEISRLGLDGLGRLLAVRTAVEPGRPMGVNILTDEIAFYPGALLAGAARRQGAARGDAGQDRRLHEAGRPHRFRYAGLRHGRRQRRRARANPRCSGSSASSTCRASSRCRRTTCSPRPSTCCATSPAAGTAASCGSRRSTATEPGPEPPRARLRRRHVDHRHAQRSRRSVGAGRRRAPALSDRRRRRGPARDGLPHRHQHRHARPDRQLQSRPGARAGTARTARAMRHSA